MLAGNAQTTYRFGYDDAGNRETRAVILLKNAGIVADTLQAKQAEKPLEDLIDTRAIKIYPNPTKGLLRIEFPALWDQETTIRVYEPSGRQIVQKRAISSGNEVDLSSYPSGTYIMLIHSGQEKKEWKIIKE
jgi:hypothetical protein